MLEISLFKDMQPNFVNADDRGTLIQLVREGYAQVNYIESIGEAVRGIHYHKQNREAFFIIKGSFDVDVWKIDKNTLLIERNSYETRHFTAGDMFYIEPYTLHVFRYHTDSSLISMYDKGVEIAPNILDMYKPEEPLPKVILKEK